MKNKDDSRYWNSMKKLLFPMIMMLLAGYAFGANTIKYTYDVLGRLTYVNDTLNGNRDYDYDKAGNRRLVSVGTATDSSAEPSGTPPAQPTASVPPQPGSTTIPAAPTGLVANQNSQCSWKASWVGTVGTLTYNFRDLSGNHSIVVNAPYVPLQVNAPYVTYSITNCDYANIPNEKPKWVQACNAMGCSDKVNFP